MLHRLGVVFLIALTGCQGRRDLTDLPPSTPGLELQPEEFSRVRTGFKTKLVMYKPSPQAGEPLRTPPGAAEVGYNSGILKLKGYVTPDPGDRGKHPAVLFLHGGFAFGQGQWETARPFRDAGYVVMTPVLRGENGQGGDFTLCYDEVDDVLAAADALAGLPYVDRARVFVAGHSVGGTLTMLAAMTSPRFRAAASMSGSPDLVNYLKVRGRSEPVPFDTTDIREFRLRSPVAYATCFKCPIRLYCGDEEYWLQGSTLRTAMLAKRAGLDVEAVEVPGGHFSSAPEAIRRSIEFFRRK